MQVWDSIGRQEKGVLQGCNSHFLRLMEVTMHEQIGCSVRASTLDCFSARSFLNLEFILVAKWKWPKCGMMEAADGPTRQATLSPRKWRAWHQPFRLSRFRVNHSRKQHMVP